MIDDTISKFSWKPVKFYPNSYGKRVGDQFVIIPNNFSKISPTKPRYNINNDIYIMFKYLHII